MADPSDVQEFVKSFRPTEASALQRLREFPSPVQRVIHLSAVRVDELVSQAGDFIIALDSNSILASLDVKLDEPSASALTLFKAVRLKTARPFRRLFLSNEAQNGKTITLVIGFSGSVDMFAATTIQSEIVRGDDAVNQEISVTNVSTALAIIPLGSVQRVRVFNRGAEDIFLSIEQAATVAMFPVPSGQSWVETVAGPHSVNAISANAAGVPVRVWVNSVL